MASYSLTSCRKVVQVYECGVGSQHQIGERFGVGLAFVDTLFMPVRRTGNPAPTPPAGGKASRPAGYRSRAARRLSKSL
jgi:transposase